MRIVDLAHTPSAEVLAQARAVLEAGGLVIFPTETTYGAGVDARNPVAVQKLLQYKARREGKPLSIAVTSPEMAEQYVELTESARRLYSRFLPGPVTVVSRSLGKVAPGVESEFGTLGVRIPDYALVIGLVTALGGPITATSANASDAKRPYSIADIMDGLSERQKSLIDLVLDAGTLPPNPPSTVIDTTLSTPVIFRQGEIKLAPKTASGTPPLTLISHSEAETKSIAGKLLLKHWNAIRAHGLVLGLDGSLGMGKTIFAKGAAEFLQISQTITSPTYSYLEEYPYTRHSTTGHLYHLDVWKIDDQASFERLEVAQLAGPGQIVIIEWYSQVAPWLQPQLQRQGTPWLAVTFSDVPDQPAHRQLRIEEYTA